MDGMLFIWFTIMLSVLLPVFAVLGVIYLFRWLRYKENPFVYKKSQLSTPGSILLVLAALITVLGILYGAFAMFLGTDASGYAFAPEGKILLGVVLPLAIVGLLLIAGRRK